MSLALYDRVRETTTVLGTNDAVLLGAVTGYQPFSVVGDTNTCYYTIADGAGNWEVGLGTYSTSGPTLARTTVYSSSNSNLKVNFPAGVKDIFLTYPSEKAVGLDTASSIAAGSMLYGSGTTAYSSLNIGTNGYVLQSNGSAPTWVAPSSIIGGAGGSDTQVQYNSSGSLAGSANLTFDGTTLTTPVTAVVVNSASDALNINQTGSGNSILIQNATSPSVVDNAGNVAIGATTAPAFGGIVRPFSVSQANNNAVVAIGRWTADNGSPGLVFQKSRDTTIGVTTTPVQNGDALGTLFFGGSDGTTVKYGAVVAAVIDNAVSTGIVPGRLTFNTADATTGTMTERMRIDSAGRVGIGGTPSGGTTLLLSKAITGGASGYGVFNFATIQSDVTSAAYGYSTYLNTQATAFTLTSLQHFGASQNTFGAGSAVTNQYGFNVDNSLTGATNNYGFYSAIAAGTGRWNFYAAGTADNYFGGSVIIGVTDSSQSYGGLAAPRLQVNGTSASTAAIGASRWSANALAGQLQLAKSRGAAVGTRGIVSSGDDLGSLTWAGDDGTNFVLGASISVQVDGTPGTNDMPGRLVFSTTAEGASSPTERMRIDSAGRVGIGASAAVGVNLYVAKNITDATTSIGVLSQSTIQSDVTNSAYLFRSRPSTAAASFTINNIFHYSAIQNIIGAGSTVTNQYGFHADSSLTGATNNYGFYSNIASGTGRWNFYAAGTAQNLFSGDVLVFGAGGLGYTTGSGGSVTQGTSRTTGVTLNKTNGAITLFSAAGSTTWQSFTVTNSTVAATDTIIVNQKSGTDLYEIHITAVAAGSFRISFKTTGGTTTEQPVFNFSVIKAVTA